MTRYLVNEMVCDNKHGLHKMEEPHFFKTKQDADEYVMKRISTGYTKGKGYNVSTIKGWHNEAGATITTLYYNGGFSEFYVYSVEI